MLERWCWPSILFRILALPPSAKNEARLATQNRHTPERFETLGGRVTLGVYLKSIRDGAGITQHAFAEMLGISVQHLSRIEHGRTHVSIDRAEAWAHTLGYPEGTFVRLSLEDQFHRAGLNGYHHRKESVVSRHSSPRGRGGRRPVWRNEVSLR